MTIRAIVLVALGASIGCLVLARAMSLADRERTLRRLRDRNGDVPRGSRSGDGSVAYPHVPPPLARAASAALAGATGFWLAGPVGALAGLVGAEVWRRSALARSRARSRALLEEQLREAVGTLSAAVRAGLSVRRALEEARRVSDPPMREVLAGTVDRLRVGQPLEAALEELGRGIGSSDAALVSALLHVHRRTGGDLPALLDEVALIVGQRSEARRQIRALTAQGRASGAVLAVLPIAFVGLLSGTSGDGLGAFYRTLPGAGLLLAGLLCEVLGFAWISRIVRAGGDP